MTRGRSSTRSTASTCMFWTMRLDSVRSALSVSVLTIGVSSDGSVGLSKSVSLRA